MIADQQSEDSKLKFHDFLFVQRIVWDRGPLFVHEKMIRVRALQPHHGASPVVRTLPCPSTA